MVVFIKILLRRSFFSESEQRSGYASIEPMKEWHVYILRCKDGSLYTGITTDIERRLEQHNAGKGASYTRSRRPVTLAWHEKMASESAARKREAEIKKWTREEKMNFLIKKHGQARDT